MLIDVPAAIFLLICLVSFASANLHNILAVHSRIGSARAKAEIKRLWPHLYPHPPTLSAKAYAKVESPSGFLIGTAAAGTITYFLLALLCPFLVFTGYTAMLFTLPVQSEPSMMFYLQIVGLVLTGTGYFLFNWSVVARGEYAVSWTMTETIARLSLCAMRTSATVWCWEHHSVRSKEGEDQDVEQSFLKESLRQYGFYFVRCLSQYPTNLFGFIVSDLSMAP